MWNELRLDLEKIKAGSEACENKDVVLKLKARVNQRRIKVK